MRKYLKYSELPDMLKGLYFYRLQSYLMLACTDYPDFSEWFSGMFDEIILKGNREIIFCEDNNIIAGAIVLKNGKEKKICTLYVSPYFRGNGIGTRLVELGIEWLQEEKPMMTVNEKRLKDFEPLLEKFGFVLNEKITGYYRPGEAEYVYNGELPKKREKNTV